MKTIMITGANSGIGYQASLQFANKGHQVVMVCRNPERGADAQQRIINATHNQNVDLLLIDLASQASIRAGVATFYERYTQLDVLINNAANFDITQKTPILTEAGIEMIFATNHLAPFLLTNLLLPAIKASAAGRILNIASKGLVAYPFLEIEFDNLNGQKKFTAARAYYHSKIAQLMFTFDLAEQLANTSVTVNAIRVPAVKLDGGRYDHIPALLRSLYRFKMNFSLSSEEMAKTYVELALSADLARQTGMYFDENCQQVKASKQTYRRDTWRQLWDVSAQLTQLAQPMPI